MTETRVFRNLGILAFLRVRPSWVAGAAPKLTDFISANHEQNQFGFSGGSKSRPCKVSDQIVGEGFIPSCRKFHRKFQMSLESVANVRHWSLGAAGESRNLENSGSYDFPGPQLSRGVTTYAKGSVVSISAQHLMNPQKVVTPVKTGVQGNCNYLISQDSGFCRNDDAMRFPTFCMIATVARSASMCTPAGQTFLSPHRQECLCHHEVGFFLVCGPTARGMVYCSSARTVARDGAPSRVAHAMDQTRKETSS